MIVHNSARRMGLNRIGYSHGHLDGKWLPRAMNLLPNIECPTILIYFGIWILSSEQILEGTSFSMHDSFLIRALFEFYSCTQRRAQGIPSCLEFFLKNWPKCFVATPWRYPLQCKVLLYMYSTMLRWHWLPSWLGIFVLRCSSTYLVIQM